MKALKTAIILLAGFLIQSTSRLAGQLPQNPSPMVETTRRHERLPKTEVKGKRFEMPVGNLLLTPEAERRDRLPLIIHFQGQPWVAESAATRGKRAAAVITAYLGAGSSRYAQPFNDPESFAKLLAAAATARSPERPMDFDPIVLSGFSAGYGAIRQILRTPANWDHVDAVVLVDGLHAGYESGDKPGPIKAVDLNVFIEFARLAVEGKKQMVVTHSTIFPGTFASTTETADYLLEQLGLRRRPVLKWGPLGMQQISHVRKGNFEMLGFAGNSAPDHIDQYHALETWLRRIKL
jgi:hypothetical protein